MWASGTRTSRCLARHPDRVDETFVGSCGQATPLLEAVDAPLDGVLLACLAVEAGRTATEPASPQAVADLVGRLRDDRTHPRRRRWLRMAREECARSLRTATGRVRGLPEREVGTADAGHHPRRQVRHPAVRWLGSARAGVAMAEFVGAGGVGAHVQIIARSGMSENSLRIDSSRSKRQAESIAASAACSVKPRWRGATALLPHGDRCRWCCCVGAMRRSETPRAAVWCPAEAAPGAARAGTSPSPAAGRGSRHSAVLGLGLGGLGGLQRDRIRGHGPGPQGCGQAGTTCSCVMWRPSSSTSMSARVPSRSPWIFIAWVRQASWTEVNLPADGPVRERSSRPSRPST